ncbi:MAG: SGNH/GDSL hydrolase family protein [Elainellaceae cyanobacterium]
MKTAIVWGLLWGLPLVIVLVSLVELGLRWSFGFGNPLLYVRDPEIGYLLAPQQDVRRFGNRIVINQYSMRGEAIQATPRQSSAAQPESSRLRLFLLGDSIANGGWWTDQDQTLSARLQRRVMESVESKSPAPYSSVEVLNASANSWGPRNELAYIQRYGTFGASALILLINTDDLFATAPTSVQVGRDRHYPDRKPPLAIAEVIGRYLMPPSPMPELQQVQAEGGDRVGQNLEAIRQIQALVMAADGQFLLALTPLLREVTPPGSRDYELKARDRLLAFTQAHQMTYLDFLPLFQAMESPHSLYRDPIHLSDEGNLLVVESLADILRDVDILKDVDLLKDDTSL